MKNLISISTSLLTALHNASPNRLNLAILQSAALTRFRSLCGLLFMVLLMGSSAAIWAQTEFTKVITSSNTPGFGMTYVLNPSCGSAPAYYGVSGNRFSRIALDGTVSWAKQYYSANLGLSNFMHLNNGDFLLIGIDDATLNGNTGSFSIYVTRVDCNGSQLWAKRYASQSGGYRTYHSSIACPSTTGLSAFIAYGWHAGGDDIFFIKIDENGGLTWEKRFGSGDTQVYGVTTDNAGGASFVFNNSDNDWKSSFGHINSSGSIDILKHFNISHTIFNLGSIQKVSTGYLIGADNGISGGNLLKIVKTDNSGNIIWVKSFPHITGNVLQYDTGLGFQEDNQGNYYCHIWRSTEQKYLKIDNNGSPIWYKQYESFGFGYIPNFDKFSLGGTTLYNGVNRYVYGITNTDFDFCFGTNLPLPVLSSESIPSPTSWTLGESSIAISITNANGQLANVNAYQTDDLCSNIPTETTATTHTNFAIFPNPTLRSATLRTTNTDLLNSPIQLYDALGRLLHITILQSTEQTIDLSEYPAGIYLLRVGSETAKVIKE